MIVVDDECVVRGRDHGLEAGWTPCWAINVHVSEPHLIATKFSVPPRRIQLINRPRLAAYCPRTNGTKLTLVSAPAGFGKSTLLATWYDDLVREGVAVGWLSLDRDDNDIGRFLAYFVAALRRADPTIGASALALIRSSPVVPADVVTTMVVNDLAARSGRLVMILDDVQVLELPSIHQTLEKLLAYAPSGFHLILAGRSCLPISVARLRVAGEVVELTEADLRFDRREAEEFLNRAQGLDLSDGDISLLLERTEGWAAGLQLISLALQRRAERASFLQTFSGSNREVTEFLASDVLLRQSQEIQNFLLRTSILERLNADLCNHLVGERNAQAMIERIDAANLFLVSLDNERHWFRYHHLFADFLRARLDRLHPGLAADLHRKAAEWYSANGAISEAVHHALAAGDAEFAAALVEGCAMALIRESRITLLMEWLNRLPENVIRSRPRLLLVSVWICVHTLTPRRGVQHLLQAKRVFGDAMRRGTVPVKAIEALRAELRTLTVGVVSGADHSRWASNLALRWLETLPSEEPFLRGTLGNILGYCLYALGDLRGTERACERARIEHARAESVLGIVYSDLLLGGVEKARGRLRRAEAILRRAQNIARDALGAGSYAEAMVAVFLAEIIYEWNDLASAERLLRDSQYVVDGAGCLLHVLVGQIHRARLQAAAGRPELALDLLDRAERLGREGLYRRLRASVLEERTRLLLRSDDVDSVRRDFARHGIDVEAVGRSGEEARWLEPERIALVRLCLAEHRLDAAMRLLGDLIDRVAAQERNQTLIRLLTLKAICYAKAGHQATAFAALRDALARAEPEGFFRSFIDEGPPLRALLGELLRREFAQTALTRSGVSRDYVKRLMCGFRDGTAAAHRADPTEANPGVEASVGALVETLTGRELDIIRLLATGCSNDELARRLSLARNTVKWHLKNIFEKLGVRSRTQAVLAAQRLKLLS